MRYATSILMLSLIIARLTFWPTLSWWVVLAPLWAPAAFLLVWMAVRALGDL